MRRRMSSSGTTSKRKLPSFDLILISYRKFRVGLASSSAMESTRHEIFCVGTRQGPGPSVDYIIHFRHNECGLRNLNKSLRTVQHGRPWLTPTTTTTTPPYDVLLLPVASLTAFQSCTPYIQVPPETYNCLIHALLSLQGTSSYPLPNHNHPWPSAIVPPPPPPTSSTAFPTTASTAQEPEGLEDATSIVEDKRRRNTAASGECVCTVHVASPSNAIGGRTARFRIRKKLKTLNLERIVTDLAGRTEELEREAADLRRENAWLKEIVFLKGRNLVASHAAAPANRHDDDGKEESEPKSSVNRREKGKDKEG